MVACTGLVNEEVIKKAIESGFDTVIEQPLNVETLRSIIIPKVLELKNIFMDKNLGVDYEDNCDEYISNQK